jgi:cobalamin biosynthesis Mg chelatase CobN
MDISLSDAQTPDKPPLSARMKRKERVRQINATARGETPAAGREPTEDYMETLLAHSTEQEAAGSFDVEGGAASRKASRKSRQKQHHYEEIVATREAGVSSSFSQFWYMYIMALAAACVLIYLLWKADILI